MGHLLWFEKPMPKKKITAPLLAKIIWPPGTLPGVIWPRGLKLNPMYHQKLRSKLQKPKWDIPNPNRSGLKFCLEGMEWNFVCFFRWSCWTLTFLTSMFWSWNACGRYLENIFNLLWQDLVPSYWIMKDHSFEVAFKRCCTFYILYIWSNLVKMVHLDPLDRCFDHLA